MQVSAGVQTICKSWFLVDLGHQCSGFPQLQAASALVTLGCCDSSGFSGASCLATLVVAGHICWPGATGQDEL